MVSPLPLTDAFHDSGHRHFVFCPSHTTSGLSLTLQSALLLGSFLSSVTHTCLSRFDVSLTHCTRSKLTLLWRMLAPGLFLHSALDMKASQIRLCYRLRGCTFGQCLHDEKDSHSVPVTMADTLGLSTQLFFPTSF